METIRLLIADDHRLFREGLLAILHGVEDIEAIGEASTGQEAVEQAMDLTPDVILMDIQMPDMSGIEATQRILEGHPQTGIIMVTMLEDDDFLFAAMRAGARGYVLKGADKGEMLKSIRAVAEGQAIFGPVVADRLADFFRAGVSGSKRGKQNKIFPELTDREYEVLDLIARGESNQVIADRLNISVKTVSNHISNIFNKLQVADRAQAIVIARDAGMGKT
jgi:DNA-binding NarL/FixJ family response regulator